MLGLSFWEVRFFELPNFLLCCLFVIIGARKLRVPVSAQLILIGHCVLPLFLTGVLFPLSYMPDQMKYLNVFQLIRSGELSFFSALQMGNVERAGAMLALVPFPVAVTPIGLGLVNTAIYTALFFWLYQKSVFTRFSMYFYLLFPSLALYSGLALRDTLIMAYMIIATQYAREGRWILMLCPLGLLFMIKMQNFYILGPALFLYIIFRLKQRGLSFANAVGTVVVGAVSLVIFTPVALPLINRFRTAMYIEDGGDIFNLELINSQTEFITMGLANGLYFLAKPFPWETDSLLQLIQSLENLCLLTIMMLLIVRGWQLAPRKVVFWVLLLMFSMSIYGLVVFNYGTTARYRYPLIVLFVIFVCSECNIETLKRIPKSAIDRIRELNRLSISPSLK